MSHKYAIHACPVCDEPTKMTDAHGRVERTYKGVNGIIVAFGYSRGGWGYRKDFIDFNSGEVCDDCFKRLEEMLKPAIEFIRNRGKRQSDPVQPVRCDQPSPEGRVGTVLRALPFMDRKTG